MPRTETWPPLPLEAWQDTLAGFHLRLQVVGKIRLACSPWLNHSWHATTYVSPRGLTTGPIPYGARLFDIELDLIDHELHVRSSDGRSATLPLQAESIAAFHQRLMATLDSLALPVRIHPSPNELPEVIRFDRDHGDRPYDASHVNRFWRVLVQADRVMNAFRSRFISKSSPVHLFWGAADLAVTRFSGRTAPAHPGGIPNLPDWVTREAYSHEVISCGFWAGSAPVAYPAFYAYAYPEPPGFGAARVHPEAAFYSRELGEFILPYDAVRASASPDETLLGFFQSSYEAAANLAGWDRAALEREPPAQRTVEPRAALQEVSSIRHG